MEALKYEQSVMTASQVPAPEPPKMEMITESYNPIDFTKEQIIDFKNILRNRGEQKNELLQILRNRNYVHKNLQK